MSDKWCKSYDKEMGELTMAAICFDYLSNDQVDDMLKNLNERHKKVCNCID